MNKDMPDFHINGDVLEDHSYLFVTKLWLEETEKEASYTKWRGSVEKLGYDDRPHKKHYFESLHDFMLIMQNYLESIGLDDYQPRRNSLSNCAMMLKMFLKEMIGGR